MTAASAAMTHDRRLTLKILCLSLLQDFPLPTMKDALGILETVGLVTLLEGVDAALKAADIKLTGWQKIGSGQVTAFFSGNVASVKAGLDAGAEAASRIGKVKAVEVIARPHDDLAQMGNFAA